MNKTKICFISAYAYPLFNPKCKTTFGGSEVQMYQYANKLSKDQKYTVDFMVANFGQKKQEIINNIKVIKTFSLNRKGIFRYLYGLSAILKLLYILAKNNSDVYIQRAAGIETGIIALYCKLFHKNYIYMTASSIDTDGEYRHQNPLEGFIYEWGIKHATHIICQNHEQETNLQKKYNIKSTVIENSFNIPQRIFSQKNFVLWVGSAQTLKQPQIFLRLAKSFPQHQFIIIIPKHNLLLWHEIRKKTRSISNINFIEKVPFNKINKYFAKAKIFVNTSTYEGFPNTFVQATMYSTPVISLNVNPDNFLYKNHCGFCAQNSFNRLKIYTQNLFTDNKLWQIMSKNSYDYAKKNHDINKNIVKLTNIINS